MKALVKTGATTLVVRRHDQQKAAVGKDEMQSAPERELSTHKATICDSATGELPDKENCTACDLVVTSQSISALQNLSPSGGALFHSPRSGNMGALILIKSRDRQRHGMART